MKARRDLDCQIVGDLRSVERANDEVHRLAGGTMDFLELDRRGAFRADHASQVAAVQVESGEVLTAYFDAVHERTMRFVATLTEADLRSRSRNSCFLGRDLQGRCLLTLAGGSVAHRLSEVPA